VKVGSVQGFLAAAGFVIGGRGGQGLGCGLWGFLGEDGLIFIGCGCWRMCEGKCLRWKRWEIRRNIISRPWN